MGESPSKWIFVLKNGDTFATHGLFKDCCTLFAQHNNVKDLVAVVKGD